MALGGGVALVLTVAAVALGGCGACGGARSRDRLGSTGTMDAAVPAWHAVIAVPRAGKPISQWPDARLADGGLLFLNEELATLRCDDVTSTRWRIDWKLKVRIERVVASSDSVWVLVQSVLGGSPVIAGTVVADGPSGRVAALVRVDAKTGVARAARLLDVPPGRDLPTRLAVGHGVLVASESGDRGGLWRIDPETLAATAYVGLVDDAFLESVDIVSSSTTCTHVTDHTARTAAYVCFDAMLREESRVPLPTLPDKIWSAQGAVTGAVVELDRDLAIELAGLPPLWVSAVCRVADERSLWDWLALYDKDGDRPPIVERCVDTRVIATSAGASVDGRRLLTIWAKAAVRIGDHVVEIDGETLILLELTPDLTVRVSTYEGCGGAELSEGRWMITRCVDAPRLVDLSD